MQYEYKKMFYLHKGLWMILLYVILNFATFFLFDAPTNPDMERNRKAYEYYLNKVDGKCTTVTESLLAEEAGRISKANSEIQRICGDYYDGKLTEKEFTSQINKAENITRRQKGFEIVYEQYNSIRENNKNRWFLYTNGWDGLLSHDSLDLPFFVLLLLLIAPIFCQEYENKMDELIMTVPRGTKNHAWCKIVLVVLMVCTLCLLNSSMRYLFYGLKYGLPHGNYPLQSLSYFATSTREVTLIGSFLEISFGKLFGSLSLAIIILFVSVCVKKYALTLFTCTTVILLPYYGLSLSSAKYFLPGPLAFMVYTGFFRGNEYRYSTETQEKLMVFQEIGGTVRWLLFGITLCFMLIMAVIIIKKHINIWCIKNYHSTNKTRFLMLSILALVFSGCSAPYTARETLFNLEQSNTFENDNYRFFVKDPLSDEATWLMENKATRKIEKMIRSPMKALSKISESIYGYGDYIYYMQKDLDESGFFTEYDRFSIVEVDTRDFTERIVFERNLNTSRDTFLGIGKPREQNIGGPFSGIEAFFLDRQNFYFIINGQVCKVARLTGKMDVIIEQPVLKSLSFDGTNIYYINEKSKLMRYDIRTEEEAELYGIVTESFLLTEEEIFFKNRLDQNKIYAINLDDGTLRRIIDESVLSFSLKGNILLYTSKKTLLEHEMHIY